MLTNQSHWPYQPGSWLQTQTFHTQWQDSKPSFPRWSKGHFQDLEIWNGLSAARIWQSMPELAFVILALQLTVCDSALHTWLASPHNHRWSQKRLFCSNTNTTLLWPGFWQPETGVQNGRMIEGSSKLWANVSQAEENKKRSLLGLTQEGQPAR